MEKMTDMKMSKSDRKSWNTAVPVGSAGPDYPWGLSINLDSAALKKLGMTELPDAGEECAIQAIGKVTRVSQSASEKGGDKSVEIQIIKLSVACDETMDADEMVKKGYAKGKGPKVGA